MLKILILPILLNVYSLHSTMTSIEHIHGTDSLKVFIKMDYNLFLRDYQTIDDDRDLHILYSYKPFPADFINNYINSKVFIYINNKLLNGKLLTMDLIEGEVSLSFLYRSDKKPKKVTVRNTILTGLHSDQVNLTIIKINDFEKGIKFTPEHNEETFNLN
jgi:hypothetical protein